MLVESFSDNRHFYPRSPCGERRALRQLQSALRDFYPRSPCGERQCDAVESFSDNRHFYPRSPCGERRALRQLQSALRDFYPRSPCGERHGSRRWTYHRGEFLSTLSLRRATCLRCCAISCITISIHALLAESDAVMDNIVFVPGEFLSTLSLRRATICPRARGSRRRIFLSTLSLRRATPIFKIYIPY